MRRLIMALAAVVCVLAGPAAGIAAASPEWQVRPEISPSPGGSIQVGERLVCSAGTWKGRPSFEYAWYREGIGVSPRAKENVTYTLSKADEHEELTCIVTATESGAKTEVESANAICLGGKCNGKGPPPEPLESVPPGPTISGKAAVGEQLTCEPGKWKGSPSEFKYRWLREKEAITGAESSTYKVQERDAGHKLSCKVTAKNSTEEKSAESESVSVPGLAPKDITPPKVQGTPAVNETLICNPGTWSGSEPFTFEYQWLRNGKAIAMEIGPDYTVKPADEGQSLACEVVATNSVGKEKKTSAAVKVSVKLKNTELPAITGTAKEGSTLTCSEGKWNESPVKVAYRWLREVTGKGVKEISGATTSEHKVVKEDLGSLLYCQVEAKYEAETVTVTSAPFPVPEREGVPVDKKLPEVEVAKGSESGGKAIVGDTLACLHGEWSPAPTQYLYEWLREEAPGKKTLIGEETLSASEPSSAYVVREADEGYAVSCKVIAKDGAGPSEKPAESNAISVAVALKNTELPVVSGTAKEGSTLTCSEGKWNEAPEGKVTYQWLREETGKGREAISGATTSEHKVAKEDVGSVLYCQVNAKHEVEEVVATSAAFPVPKEGVPVDKKAPEVEVSKGSETGGKAVVGDTLACLHGEWSPAPTQYLYEWLREETPGKKTLIREETLGAGTSSSEYVVQPADEGYAVSCEVIAKNSEGPSEKPAESKNAISVAVALKNTELPVVTKEGSTLTCSKGSWSDSPVEVTYQWLRETEGVRKEISGATTSEHKVVKEDLGSLLYCEVKAKHETEEVTARSAPFPISKEGVPEVEVAKGSESRGKAIVGDTLACLHGEWSPAPTQYLYEWLREEAPGHKTLITSETLSAAEPSSAYIVQEADEGYTVSCAVIAKNSEGPSEPAESNAISVAGEIPLSIISPQITPDASPAREGESLSCLRGTWVGEPEPTTFIYTWFREGAESIAEGETSAYKIGKEDRGHWLSCTVTASNNQGHTVAASSNKVYVQGTEPEAPAGWPKIVGEPTVGSVLTCEADASGWTGAPAPALTFQWLLNGTPIPSATLSQFTVTAADRGSNLTCTVTGTNDEGTRSVTSALVHIAGEAPKVIEEPPYIAGTGAVGRTLTCERGTWAGEPAPSFEYQWYRNGVPIAAATEQKYTVEPADQEHTLSCRVIATNIEGSAEVESVNSVAIVTHTAQSKVGGSKTTDPPPVLAPPNSRVILASLERQLTTVLSKARLKAVRKAGGFAFPFIPPWEGTLEVSWYQVEKVKTAHGVKRKRLVLALSHRSYTSTAESSFKLKLTSYGRLALAHSKRMELTMEVAFTIAHDKPVTWYATFVLGSAEPEVR